LLKFPAGYLLMKQCGNQEYDTDIFHICIRIRVMTSLSKVILFHIHPEKNVRQKAMMMIKRILPKSEHSFV